MHRLLLILVLALAGACATSHPTSEPTQVLAIAAIHSAHQDHPAYTYEDLYATVRAFDPDVVAVEMRQEDIGRDAAYLARNYPLEMRELAREHEPKARGIDWLGVELEGRPVPDDWWKHKSWVKRLEREMAKDAGVRTPEADALQERQMAIVRSATAASLNDGRYDELTRAYYRALDAALAGTRYASLTAFYRERDRRIADNVAKIVAENPGRRIAVVLGADHRAPVVDELSRRYGRAVELVPVR